MIILVVGISLLASFFIGNSLINTPANRSAEIEVVTPISAEFPAPSPKIFNSTSINPTERIEIQDNDTVAPFEVGDEEDNNN